MSLTCFENGSPYFEFKNTCMDLSRTEEQTNGLAQIYLENHSESISLRRDETFPKSLLCDTHLHEANTFLSLVLSGTIKQKLSKFFGCT